METLLYMVGFSALFLVLAGVDKKFQLGLCSDQQASAGGMGLGGLLTEKQAAPEKLEKENQQLRQRIEVLERIVTEPGYELDREIRRLADN